MHFKFRKNLRIINELITCIHKLGAKDINFNLNENEKETFFTIWGEVNFIEESHLENIVNLLSTKRQHEIEEYYWNLPSDYDSESQLSIVGMMIDFAEVIYDNNILTIKLSRMDE